MPRYWVRVSRYMYIYVIYSGVRKGLENLPVLSRGNGLVNMTRVRHSITYFILLEIIHALC